MFIILINSALVTKDVLNKIQALNSPFGNFIVELLMFFASTYKTVFKFEDPPLHDPVSNCFFYQNIQ